MKKDIRTGHKERYPTQEKRKETIGTSRLKEKDMGLYRKSTRFIMGQPTIPEI